MITQIQPKITNCFSTVISDIGPIHLWSDGSGICSVQLPGMEPPVRMHTEQREDDITRIAARQLKDWLSGKHITFHVPLSIKTTAFTKKVYDQLCSIPSGTTISYGALATLAGVPRGARAVAMAMMRNPVPILIPCHRVVGANGQTVGYMGKRKNPVQDYLLSIERQTGGVR